MDVALDGVTAANFAETVEERSREAASMELDYQFHLTLDDLMGNVPSRLYSKMFAAHGEQRVRHGLLTLLDASSNMQVSRGQDRLYAIMHLADDYEEGSIIVDYKKPKNRLWSMRQLTTSASIGTSTFCMNACKTAFKRQPNLNRMRPLVLRRSQTIGWDVKTKDGASPK
jgi:hypothetical protein